MRYHTSARFIPFSPPILSLISDPTHRFIRERVREHAQFNCRISQQLQNLAAVLKTIVDNSGRRLPHKERTARYFGTTHQHRV